MSKLQPIRGTHDLLPDEFERFHVIQQIARGLAKVYGYREMATPIFEPTQVFSRSLGVESDIVHKEMFTFETKGGDSVTLRPEFTAGIVRAFLSNGMQQHLPLKIFSTGPLFRYERPQKGRQRQFHQVNFESLGDDSAETDIEVILLACHFIQYLEFGKDIQLHINTLGDKESRERYRVTLTDYLRQHADKLSEDSKRRLETNPLRILDSKDEGDRAIVANAPSIHNALSDASRERFEKIRAFFGKEQIFLPANGVVFNDKLVRGLDYYTDTVFEFISYAEEMGSQNTVLAGGRYDGLIELMGGKPTPAIGFGAGIERLLLMTDIQRQKPDPIFIIPEKVDKELPINIAAALRMLAIIAYDEAKQTDYPAIDILRGGGIGDRIKKAVTRGAKHVVVIGKEEEEKGFLTIQDLTTTIRHKNFTIKDLRNACDEAQGSHYKGKVWSNLKALIPALDPYAKGTADAV